MEVGDKFMTSKVNWLLTNPDFTGEFFWKAFNQSRWAVHLSEELVRAGFPIDRGST